MVRLSVRKKRSLGYSGFMNSETLFRGKRITVLGLGVLGRGVGDAEFLAKCGAKVLVTDKKNEIELAESVERLKKYSNVTFRLGGHEPSDFKEADMVVKAAGVPLNSPEIAAAKEAGVPVVMSTALFAKYAGEAGATIVGVTGTRGKSTITHMIFHALQEAGKNPILGGNVRGISTLAMLPEVEKGDIAVLELDSWQLQGFGDLKISPHIAVFSNLMPDHQNYYPNMQQYFEDKSQIYRNQRMGDMLFVGAAIADRIRASLPPVDPIVPELIPVRWELQTIGAHNRENASLAAAALEALGLSEEEIKRGLETFTPVEGRLQLIREIGGVKIFNDNNATTPDATIAALEAVGAGTTLILGGSEKDLSLTALIEAIEACCDHVIVLTHTNYRGSERLKRELTAAGVAFEEVPTLERALEVATRNKKSGAILFSPAFASFGMFNNEYERNDQFMQLVRRL